MNPRIQELRGIINRSEITLESIRAAIQEINRDEGSFLKQIVTGTYDKTKGDVLKQRLEQFELSREDKNALLKNEIEFIAERNSALEELMNILRVENGLPEIKDLIGNDVPEKQKANTLNKQNHPGNVPPIVIGTKR